MDTKFESFYRSIYADLTVDHEESETLKARFVESNPPPDKLVWLRATAFRIGCEFLSGDGDKESDVRLLRSINAIVHALEVSCMVSAHSGWGETTYDQSTFEEKLRDAYNDGKVDYDENHQLMEYLTANRPPSTKLVTVRATAFKIGCEFLSEDDKSKNVNLLRCINVVIHAFEHSCMKPKPYTLHVDPPATINVDAVGTDASISKATQYLWDLDMNRLTPNVDYTLNVQEGKKPYKKTDLAPDPLFMRVDTTCFQRPTYKAFIALLDNYKAEIGVAEYVSNHERTEVWTFLRAIMQTAPMQFCHKYCHANKPSLVSSSPDEFMKLLHKIWFEMYHRSYGGRPDSSGFEHVFVGEIDEDKVSGFHNWIQFYIEEKKGNVDYLGYIKPRSKNNALADDNDHLLSLQFKWKGVEKFVGSSFIGVSPEFEMALYTICFLVGEEKNRVELSTGTDYYEIDITCYKMDQTKVGTSFPDAVSHFEE